MNRARKAILSTILALSLLLALASTALAAGPYHADVEWNSPRTVTAFGNPATVSYTAWGTIRASKGSLAAATVTVTDRDTLATLCVANLTYAGPYQSIWSCGIPLTDGKHHLRAEAGGNYFGGANHVVTVSIH